MSYHLHPSPRTCSVLLDAFDAVPCLTQASRQSITKRHPQMPRLDVLSLRTTLVEPTVGALTSADGVVLCGRAGDLILLLPADSILGLPILSRLLRPALLDGGLPVALGRPRVDVAGLGLQLVADDDLRGAGVPLRGGAIDFTTSDFVEGGRESAWKVPVIDLSFP